LKFQFTSIINNAYFQLSRTKVLALKFTWLVK